MPSSEPRAVAVRATPIELAPLLKFAGLCATGGEAKQAIAAGDVEVNGSVETRKGRKLGAGDRVAYHGQTLLITLAPHGS